MLISEECIIIMHDCEEYIGKTLRRRVFANFTCLKSRITLQEKIVMRDNALKVTCINNLVNLKNLT